MDAGEVYYDNAFEACAELLDGLFIDRVYRLDFSRFDAVHWRALGEIYQDLPEFQGYGEDGCPMWFGVDEDKIPFLAASVEPSGLHVFGVVDAASWASWDRRFRDRLVPLPLRCGPGDEKNVGRVRRFLRSVQVLLRFGGRNP